jgi:hypothetical protein
MHNTVMNPEDSKSTNDAIASSAAGAGPVMLKAEKLGFIQFTGHYVPNPSRHSAPCRQYIAGALLTAAEGPGAFDVSLS